jgi:anaerobic selenocysteine-containing dehydrogenase
VQISRADARERGIRNGETVTVSSNGTSVELRARIVRDLQAGVLRVADGHAEGLHEQVELA